MMVRLLASGLSDWLTCTFVGTAEAGVISHQRDGIPLSHHGVENAYTIVSHMVCVNIRQEEIFYCTIEPTYAKLVLK